MKGLKIRKYMVLLQNENIHFVFYSRMYRPRSQLYISRDFRGWVTYCQLLMCQSALEVFFKTFTVTQCDIICQGLLSKWVKLGVCVCFVTGEFCVYLLHFDTHVHARVAKSLQCVSVSADCSPRTNIGTLSRGLSMGLGWEGLGLLFHCTGHKLSHPNPTITHTHFYSTYAWRHRHLSMQNWSNRLTCLIPISRDKKEGYCKLLVWWPYFCRQPVDQSICLHHVRQACVSSHRLKMPLWV